MAEQTVTAQAILLHDDDDVVVATRSVAAGEAIRVAGADIVLRQAVPAAHKIARRTIAAGSWIRKYGQPIAQASEAIAAGDWVHEHNCGLGAVARQQRSCDAVPPDPAPLAGLSFQGYRRADGRVGTRNYLLVASSVTCSASVASAIAAEFTGDWLADHPQIDGVLAITHKGGCAIQVDGDEYLNLHRTLSGYCRHPNVGGVLLVGLGCETLSAGRIAAGQDGQAAVPVLSMQEQGGTRATIAAGVQALAELLPQADAVRRETIPASELVLGLECGGSDGASGITANPVIGAAVDRLIAAGGTAILAETPEIYGAEHLLTSRARTPAVAEALRQRIAWWERYADFFGATIDNNPTTGNKAGGLTTIFEKSLGAVAKAGGTALEGVYRYGERIDRRGLVFMDTPGFDPVSVTGMVAGGANLVCFSTGRGSCFGCKPTPSLKIASNTAVYQRLREDMDFDAGRVLAGASVAALGAELLDQLLAVASGETTASERLGLGDQEFAPWSVGPVF